MIFTLENIINSLAGVLTARYPDYPVYASPNQQGTDHPCFFIFFIVLLFLRNTIKQITAQMRGDYENRLKYGTDEEYSRFILQQ